MSDSLIYKKMVAVMEEVGSIGKAQKNTFDNYKFRGIDDVYNAVQPALVKHGVVVVPMTEECAMDTYTTTKGAVMQRAVVKVDHVFYAEDGSCISAVTMGEGADRGDKAVNKAHSSAFKTALFQSLCIPTEERSDSENESPDGQKPESVKKAPKKTAAKKVPKAKPANDGRVEAKDLVTLQNAIRERLKALELPEEDMRICGVDVVRELGFEKSGDIPQESLPAALALVAQWTPKDSAPGFADGEGE